MLDNTNMIKRTDKALDSVHYGILAYLVMLYDYEHAPEEWARSIMVQYPEDYESRNAMHNEMLKEATRLRSEGFEIVWGGFTLNQHWDNELNMHNYIGTTLFDESGRIRNVYLTKKVHDGNNSAQE